MLQIGDGEESSNGLGENTIEIPEDLLITNNENPLLLLVHETYPSMTEILNNLIFF